MFHRLYSVVVDAEHQYFIVFSTHDDKVTLGSFGVHVLLKRRMKIFGVAACHLNMKLVLHQGDTQLPEITFLKQDCITVNNDM